MAPAEQAIDLDTLCSRIQESIAQYAGRIEYGNLRSRIDKWDCGGGEPTTNIAIVYETPGGSTDQINITFYHDCGSCGLVDEQQGEFNTTDLDSVISTILSRVCSIPEKRRETLLAEIRRQIDSGSNHAGLFGHLNRMMRSDFVGGTITHIEMRDAMTFAVQYMKGKAGGCCGGPA